MLSKLPNGLNVIPALADDGSAPSAEDYTAVIDVLRDHVGVVVIDCGSDLFSDATVTELESSDQAVLVSGTDPLAGLYSAQALHDIESFDRPVTIVVNRFPESGTRVDITRLVGIPEEVKFLAISILPESPEGANECRGRFVHVRDAPSCWTETARELALILAGRWRSKGLGVITEH